MDPPLVNEASFTASANPSSYSLAGLLSFPISGNGGLGLKMGGGDGGASLEESTVTTDQSGGGGIKRTRTARDEEDNAAAVAAANFFDHHNHHHHLRESAVKRSKSSGSNDENSGIKTEAKANSGTSVKPVNEKGKPEPLKDYIHVRARRGQATDSHSLAERARREKISERMKILQDLVPGCNKVIGKALVLDEIINYVQSLQRQVEFLSMKLEAVNSRMNPAVEGFPSKGLVAPPSDAIGLMYGSQAHREYAQGTELEWLQMQVRSGFQRAT